MSELARSWTSLWTVLRRPILDRAPMLSAPSAELTLGAGGGGGDGHGCEVDVDGDAQRRLQTSGRLKTYLTLTANNSKSRCDRDLAFAPATSTTIAHLRLAARDWCLWALGRRAGGCLLCLAHAGRLDRVRAGPAGVVRWRQARHMMRALALGT